MELEIYVAHTIKTAELLPILQGHSIGLEVELFSSSKVLDNLEEYVQSYRATFGDYLNTRNISIHGPFNELIPASRDLEIRKLTKKRFEAAFQMAQNFGAKRIVYHTGFIPKTYSSDEWLENSIEFWQDFTRDKLDDMQVHIENVYEDDFALMADVVDAINHPNFSVCLDLGHVNANSSKSIEYWIEGLNSRIKHVHLHNNDGHNDNHYGLQNGTIDYSSVLRMLKLVAPDVSWTLEIVKPVEVVESLAFLSSIGLL